MTRSKEEFEFVLDLVARGVSDREIARRTGISRRTVGDWRCGRFNETARSPRLAGHHCVGGHDFSTLLPAGYSYLLGMYLGDGCLSEGRRGVFRLRIVCDTQYPGIIEECCDAM